MNMVSLSLQPLVSIIIVNYNGRSYLEECLRSIESNDYTNIEIILVDNASSDDSIHFCSVYFPQVKILSLEKNYGFAEGNNRGVGIASGEYIVFVNNDTKVTHNWLTALLEAKDLLGEDHMYSSKVFFYDRPEIINTIGGAFTPIGSGIDIGFDEMDSGQHNTIRTVGSPAGCSMLVRKDLFVKLGAFDSDYFAYFEDVDLGWRCWMAGHQVFSVPASVLYHIFGGTAGPRNSSLRVYYGQQNRLANLLKNYSLQYMLIGFLFSAVYDTIRMVRFICSGEYFLAIALLRGTAGFFKDIPETIRKRIIIQGARMVSDRELYAQGLIIPIIDCIRFYQKYG